MLFLHIFSMLYAFNIVHYSKQKHLRLLGSHSTFSFLNQFCFVLPLVLFSQCSHLNACSRSSPIALKSYSRLLYNSFDFVYFVFIWKHLYLLHFSSMWFHLPFKVVLKIFPWARALLKQVQDYLVTTILGFDKSIVWRLYRVSC